MSAFLLKALVEERQAKRIRHKASERSLTPYGDRGCPGDTWGSLDLGSNLSSSTFYYISDV